MQFLEKWLLGIEVSDALLFGSLLALWSMIGMSVYRAHKLNGSSYYNKFNLIDLICTREGRVDRPAFLELSTFVLIAWGFVVLVSKQQWGLLVAYGGMMTGVFVLRAAHSAYLKCQSADQPKEEGTKDGDHQG